MGFERADAWRTAPNLLAEFPEEGLWSTRTIPFADLAGGATLCDEPRRSGAHALRWDNHPRYPTLHTVHVPKDWSSFGALSIWVHSAQATGERVTVAAASDSADSAWQDFMLLTFTVDWTGWRQIRLALKDFQSYGTPAGWDKVDGLYFFTKIFARQPHPETRLCLDDMALLAGDSFTSSVAPVVESGAPGLPIKGQIAAFDASVLNHTGPELQPPQVPAAPIRYEPYFLTERALFGYYPRFQPGFVSVDPEGTPYVVYGSCILQTRDGSGTWQARDLLRDVIEPYARETLGFKELGVGNTGQGNDPAIRFDNDGDAYLLAYIWDPTKDWRSRTGLLLHSRDDLNTWAIYELPTYFARFEKMTGHNPDCRLRPPVLLLSTYFAPTEVSLLIPEKRPDGTLRLPEPVALAEDALAFLPHSGEGNQAVTHGDQVFIVYGRMTVLPGHTLEDGVPAFAVRYDIPSKTLSEPVLMGFGGRNAKDSHNWPAIAVDSRGFFHVIINGHHDPFVYVRSREPWSIDAWTSPESVAQGTTYAGLVVDDQDTLYSVTRCSHPGYYFRLTLHRKRAGEPWEEPRHLVIPYKPYYKVWFHKLVIDPVSQRLFLSYFSQSASICVFKDELQAYLYTWPDREKRFLSGRDEPLLPTGTYRSDPRKYAFYSPPPSEMCILVSDDRGETWRLAVSEDVSR